MSHRELHLDCSIVVGAIRKAAINDRGTSTISESTQKLMDFNDQGIAIGRYWDITNDIRSPGLQCV